MDQAFGDLAGGHEGALALDPFDHAVVFELPERLPDHGAGNPVQFAHPVLARETVSRCQLAG
jgi:hypothetical protein